MTRRPGERDPEPPGGRAAERLREFLEHRFPGGTGPAESETDPHEERPGEEEGGAQGERDVSPEEDEGGESDPRRGGHGSAS